MYFRRLLLALVFLSFPCIIISARWCSKNNECYEELNILEIANVSVNRKYSSYKFDNTTSPTVLFQNKTTNSSSSFAIYIWNPIEIQITLHNRIYVTIQHMSIIGNNHIGHHSAINNMRWTYWSNESYVNSDYEVYDIGPCPIYNQIYYECMPYESYAGNVLNWYTNQIFVRLYMCCNDGNYTNISIYHLKFYGVIGKDNVSQAIITTAFSTSGTNSSNGTTLAIPNGYCSTAKENDRWFGITQTIFKSVMNAVILVLFSCYALCRRCCCNESESNIITEVENDNKCCNKRCRKRCQLYGEIIWRISSVITLSFFILLFQLIDVYECQLSEEHKAFKLIAGISFPASISMYRILYISGLIIALILEIYIKSKRFKKKWQMENHPQDIEMGRIQSVRGYSVASQSRVSTVDMNGVDNEKTNKMKDLFCTKFPGWVENIISLSFTVIFRPFYTASKIYCDEYEQYPDLIDSERCEEIDAEPGTDDYYYIAWKMDDRVAAILQLFVIYVGCIVIIWCLGGIWKFIESWREGIIKGICGWLAAIVSILAIGLFIGCLIGFVLYRIIFAWEDFNVDGLVNVLWALLELKNIVLLLWFIEAIIDITQFISNDND